MEGVWSWADRIEAIHSQSPSYGLQNRSGNPKKALRQMKFWRMKTQCLQDEGVDGLSHRICVGF